MFSNSAQFMNVDSLIIFILVGNDTEFNDTQLLNAYGPKLII